MLGGNPSKGEKIATGLKIAQASEAVGEKALSIAERFRAWLWSQPYWGSIQGSVVYDCKSWEIT